MVYHGDSSRCSARTAPTSLMIEVLSRKMPTTSVRLQISRNPPALTAFAEVAH